MIERPPAHTPGTRSHDDALLDEELEETLPASEPIQWVHLFAEKRAADLGATLAEVHLGAPTPPESGLIQVDAAIATP